MSSLGRALQWVGAVGAWLGAQPEGRVGQGPVEGAALGEGGRAWIPKRKTTWPEEGLLNKRSEVSLEAQG